MFAGGSFRHCGSGRRLSSYQVEGALDLLERCADRKAKLVITGVARAALLLARLPLPSRPSV